MQFSMIFEAQLAPRGAAAERQVFHECVEQAELADQMGFDRVWAVEHHCLEQYAHMSAPETFLSYVAARTRNVRVGHGVVCVPYRYNHPIRVAERTALLDILSEGRVDVGVGKGATEEELGAFGVTREETQVQLEETLRMLPGMWTQDEFSYESDTISIPSRRIIPKPVQDPHPPLFMACTKQASLELAGSIGIGALALGFAGPDDIAEKNDIYRKAIASRDPNDVVGLEPNDHLSALCPAIVLDDAEEARRIGFRGQQFFVEAIDHWARGGPLPSTDDLDGEQALRAAGERVTESYVGSEKISSGSGDATQEAGAHHYNLNQAYGNVADAIDYIERLKAAGSDEIMFLLQMGTVPHEAIMQSIENIGREVIPHFRAQEGR